MYVYLRVSSLVIIRTTHGTAHLYLSIYALRSEIVRVDQCIPSLHSLVESDEVKHLLVLERNAAHEMVLRYNVRLF